METNIIISVNLWTLTNSYALRVDIMWRNYQWKDCPTEESLADIPI